MLKGKTAVITGGSRGIGRAIALKMAENGADVAIVFSGNQKAAEETAADAGRFGARAMLYQCDVAQYEQVQQVCKNILTDFGSVDILVNNAGITKDNLLISMKEEDFDSVIGVNLKGVFHFTKHLTRSIIKSPCGRIINISSVSGIMGNAGQANYAAAKAGVIGLTKTTAKELASRHVTCNAIAPGFIETDMTVDLPQAVMERAYAGIPLKRMGKADEVASLAVFLASEQAAYITGEVIRVDGGMCI